MKTTRSRPKGRAAGGSAGGAVHVAHPASEKEPFPFRRVGLGGVLALPCATWAVPRCAEGRSHFFQLSGVLAELAASSASLDGQLKT